MYNDEGTINLLKTKIALIFLQCQLIFELFNQKYNTYFCKQKDLIQSNTFKNQTYILVVFNGNTTKEILLKKNSTSTFHDTVF